MPALPMFPEKLGKDEGGSQAHVRSPAEHRVAKLLSRVSNSKEGPENVGSSSVESAPSNLRSR